MVHDIFPRKFYFFNHYLLEKRSPSYAVVADKFIIFGGSGDDQEFLPKQTTEYQIVPFTLAKKSSLKRLDSSNLFQQ